MSREELVMLFTVLEGYWPHSCPDIDNQIDVAAWWQEMHELQLDNVIHAVREAAKTREFCPPCGILAEMTRHPSTSPPYHQPLVLPESPADIASPEVAEQMLAEARAQVRAARAKQKEEDHG